MYEKMKKQNKIIQLIQNIALTILAIELSIITLQFYGIVGGFWDKVGSLKESVDDMAGYALLANGTAGILGSVLIGFMIIMVIVLVGGLIFFWVMFGLAYSKNASPKKYCACTGVEAGAKTVLISGSLIAMIGDTLKQLIVNGVDGFMEKISSNISIWNLLWILYMVGSIKVLWNIYKMKKEDYK